MSKPLRIRSLSASGFRGCAKPLTISFCTAKNEPVSALIFGDNGSGKSTVLDAIEFAIQARVGRSQRIDPENGPSLLSLAVDELPDVSVTLSDESICRRRIVRFADDTLRINPTYGRKEFQLAPICLKRADILRFLDRPAAERAMVFSDYFPRPHEQPALAEDLELGIRERRAAAKVKRRGFVAELAKFLGLDSVPGYGDGTPKVDQAINAQQFQAFKKDHLSGAIKARTLSHRLRHSELVQLFERVEEATVAVNDLNREFNSVKIMRSRGLAHIGGAFESISTELTASFLEITGVAYVAGVDVLHGVLSPMSVELVVRLKNGRSCTPQQIFSEGLQDLLSLLFFFAVLKVAADHGQQRILLMDDVLQSVDSVVRVGVMRYVLREFRDWQILITLHDRLWREMVRDLFRQAGVPFMEAEFRRWEFEHGPMLSSPSHVLDGLNSALQRGSPSSICAEAGRLMELVADKLSWTVGSSVIRRKEDKYTLNDLWPGVRKALKGSVIEPEANRVNELLPLRNLVGAHYNEWAASLSDSEADAFGNAVLAFVARVFCKPCLQLIEMRNGGVIGCRCGAVQLTLK